MLLQVGRVLHTRYCPCLILGFPNLPQKINLAKRSTTPSGCYWQSARGWCLQVLSLPSPTCRTGSDSAVTQNGTRPHIPERARGRYVRDKRLKGQRRGRLVPSPSHNLDCMMMLGQESKASPSADEGCQELGDT